MEEIKGISVIIPLYNSQSTIIETLNSICNQTRADLIKEILVINDGSSDNSAELVEKYSLESVITVVLINKENGGVSSARNVGIQKAKEEWLAFCDADDTWMFDKIEKQAKIVLQKDVDLIGGNHTRFPLQILLKRITNLHKATVKELCIKMYPQTSTILVKKKLCLENGCFDEKQLYAEDGNLFIKIAATGNYYYLPDQIAFYDNGKNGFGVSGLSANLKGMHKGSMKNLDDLFRLGYISKFFRFLMKVYYTLKYFRRIVIVCLRK